MTKRLNMRAMGRIVGLVGLVAVCGFASAAAPDEPAPRITIKTTTGTMTVTPRPTPPIRPDYTSRPILAVGTIKSIDTATSSVVLLVDRDRSSLPNILRVRAREAGLEQMLLDREFPPERRYTLTPRTILLDTRETTATLPANLRQDKKIDLADFRPGEWVSVLYRMRQNPDLQPGLYNMSKVDPNRTFQVDYNPMGMGARPSFIRGGSHGDLRTTDPLERRTRTRDAATTRTRPRRPMGQRPMNP